MTAQSRRAADLRHWHASSALGLLICWQYRPVCSLVYAGPDCAARRAFFRWADWYFNEPRHCRRMHLIWLAGRNLT